MISDYRRITFGRLSGGGALAGTSGVVFAVFVTTFAGRFCWLNVGSDNGGGKPGCPGGLACSFITGTSRR